MCGTKCGKRTDGSWKRAIGLKYGDPSDFVLPMWSGPSIVYAIYRWIWAIFFLSILIVSLVENEGGAKWLIWLTNWGYLVLTLNVSLQAILVTQHYLATRNGADAIHGSMPACYKLAWVLQNVTIATAPIITTIYWTVVYTGKRVRTVNATTHAVNLAYVVLDIFISGIPTRVFHAYQPMTFGAIYSLFSVIFWRAGGTTSNGKPYIYTILDYGNRPELAIASNLLLVFLVVPLIFVIWWLLYKCKVLILTSCCMRRKVEPITLDDNETVNNGGASSITLSDSHII